MTRIRILLWVFLFIGKISMNLSEFKTLAKTYSAIPVYRKLLADVVTPVSLFIRLREGAVLPFLLESVEGGEHLARYSFIGSNPYQVLTSLHGRPLLKNLRDEEEHEFEDAGYYDVLRQLTNIHNEPKLPGLPRLTGGAVGYSSYDTIRYAEHLPNVPKDDLNLPEAQWAFYDEIFAIDHVKHQVILIKTVFVDPTIEIEAQFNEANKRLDYMQTQMDREIHATDFSLGEEPLSSNTEKSHFLNMVEVAKKHIYEGDIFQVVLSQRFKKKFDGDRFMLYRALRMVNPSPYLFYLDFGQFALIGSSPEVLVRVQNGVAEVLPIAGTRPRGATTEEDLAYETDLSNDPKEVAEHIMLVDLGRNDLSRICKSGTVKVTRSKAIERYSHVMHIVSDVQGMLSDDMTSVDALVHCFPAGTVSGAPKVRAMEIIDDLEVSKRGPYAGAVGYFDFSGNMDTCIAIRTMVATNDTVYIQAGAGIVADSVAENEYQETVNKAKALVEALSVALELNSK
jgi:anthranilate synthase component 1